MIAELPQQCDIGAKKNSQGHEQYWRGYKLHLDVADGQVPISAVLTSASVHDSQVAIPLMTITSQRGTKKPSQLPKMFPVEPAPQLSWAERERFKERTMIERVNARLKDEFGASHLRVRGAVKVLALTVDQWLRLGKAG